MTDLKHPILTDKPADRDGLDFQPYVEALADLIKAPGTSTPLTIGLFGQWGSGKTTLMRLIQQQVEADQIFKTVWFNAWKYEREEIALWRVLILRTLDALRPRREDGSPYPVEELSDSGQQELVKKLDRLEQSVYTTVEWQELGQWTLDWAKALGGTVEGAAEIALSLAPGGNLLIDLVKKVRKSVQGEEPSPIAEAFQREAQEFRREQLRSVEQFITTFEETINEYVFQNGGRLVIFIDDLDRCLPERTVEVLEAIKLFLDVPGCLFLLGVDPDKVQAGIRLRYKTAFDPEEGANYLEKIIQVPFILPEIDPQDMRGFVAQLNVDFPTPGCVDIFALGLAPNPRQIKRAINIFMLLWRLAEKRRLKRDHPPDGDAAPAQRETRSLSEVLTPLRLAKVVVIQHSHPDLYDLIRLTPRYLRDLERYFVEEEAKAEAEAKVEIEGAETAGEAEAQRRALPGPLEPFGQRATLRRLFRLFPDDNRACFRDLKPEQLRMYITLTGRAETERRPTREVARHSFEPEMVTIPAGTFLMGTPEAEAQQLGEEALRETPQHEVELPAYQIGRYPVTNLEYKAFVEATNYDPPRHWENGQFPDDLASHPVTYVSLEDATAYCEWLAEATGKPYRLPTEQEWERAARGTDGRRYPWGNDWAANKANTEEAGVGTTTPVGQYSPEGDSPAGCADMAGNVWEWTASDFDVYPGSSYQDENYGKGWEVLRGGSFYNNKNWVRAAFRDRVRRRRYWDLGLRVACAAPASPAGATDGAGGELLRG